MRNLLIFCFILCAMGSTSGQVISQQVVNATGYSANTKTINLSWSVGEPAIATLSGTSVVLTQGFLQPDVHAHSSGIETVDVSNNISVFPNPVHDLLFIKQNGDLIETVALYNALGQRIMGQKFENHVLDLSLLKPGVYFINLTNYGGAEAHTFKIIKY